MPEEQTIGLSVSMRKWSELKLLLRDCHMTAWLQFSKQHSNELEHVKEIFFSLTEHEFRYAISTESQKLLVTAPVRDTRCQRFILHNFGDPSEWQLLKNHSSQARNFTLCINHVLRFFNCSYLPSNMFHQTKTESGRHFQYFLCSDEMFKMLKERLI